VGVCVGCGAALGGCCRVKMLLRTTGMTTTSRVGTLRCTLGLGMTDTSVTWAQETAITALSCVANAAGSMFATKYATFMPGLKTLVSVPPTTEEAKTLRGRAMECFAIVGEAAGETLFRADAEQLLQALLAEQRAGQLPPTDAQTPYVLVVEQSVSFSVVVAGGQVACVAGLFVCLFVCLFVSFVSSFHFVLLSCVLSSGQSTHSHHVFCGVVFFSCPQNRCMCVRVARSFVLRTCSRIASVMGEDFAKYLPVVLPPLLKSAAKEPEMAITSANDGSVEDDDNMMSKTYHLRGMGELKISLNTSAMMEKELAVRSLYSYANDLQAVFLPHAAQVAAVLGPLTAFQFNADIRLSACMALPRLLYATLHGLKAAVRVVVWGVGVACGMVTHRDAVCFHARNGLLSDANDPCCCVCLLIVVDCWCCCCWFFFFFFLLL